MGSIQQMIAQLRNMYAELSTGKKLSFAIFFAMGIASFVVLVMVAKRPDYRVLYSDLSAEDMSTVVASLKEKRIEHQIGGAGTTIMVPSKDFYDVRMQLASDGLPQGGIAGFELFDQKTLGMTDFQQSINFQRALQGELARTIMQLGSVESCRVHLVMPKETLFKEDQKDPTASIAVKLRAKHRLTEEQVDSIVFLVSGSVEGLDPSDVTIIDSRGKVLSKKSDDEMAGPVNSAMLQYKSRMERDMELSVVSLLAKSIGAEKVSAKVSADLDFRQITRTEEKYDPDSQVARSEQAVSEKSDESNVAEAGGVPGTDANMPDDAYGGGGNNSSETSERATKTINYEIDRVVSQIEEPVGNIKKLSIAVMIDGTYKSVEGTRTYQPRTDEEMKKFTELVKKTVGFNEKRGDQLEVVNIAFAADEVFDEQGGGVFERREMIFTIVEYSLMGLGMLFFVLFVLRPLIKWLTAEPAYEAVAELAGMLPSGVTDLERQLTGEVGGVPEKVDDDDEEEEEEANEEAQRLAQLAKRRRKLVESAETNKKAIAAMMKKWLKEDEA